MSEGDWENYAKEVLVELAWHAVEGRSIAPGNGERQGWDDLVLKPRLLDALRRFNPDVPGVYLQQAFEEIVSPRSDDPISENHRIHDWLVASQVTVRRSEFHRRFDLVLYCNGMPVSIIELKRAASRPADPAAAHAQLQTYLREFPMAFRFAVLTVISDGITARYGTPFTALHHFAPWNVDDGAVVVAPGSPGLDGEPVKGLELLLHGVFNQDRFLQLLRWFTAFDGGDEGLAKRIAKPHQYFAVAKAVGSTVEAVRSDGKAGVVWHTQGSGKSMEMEPYTNRIIGTP
jgi:type I restriction enzyme R subunit